MLLTMAVAVLVVAIVVLANAGRRRGLTLGSRQAPASPWPQPDRLETDYRSDVHEGGASKVWFDKSRPGVAWRRMTPHDQDVVGEEYHLAALRSFLFGCDHEVWIVRESLNAHDPNALRVDGSWSVGGVRQTGCIGYLPNGLAAALARARPPGMQILATPESLYYSDAILDLKVALFEPSEASGYWAASGLEAPPPVEPD